MKRKAQGGMADFVDPADLPEQLRLAVLKAELAAHDLSSEGYDETAHSAFLAAPPGCREIAKRKADILYSWVALDPALRWAHRIALVRAEHGEKGVTKNTLKRDLKTVQGVKPINWAPALLPAYKANTAREDASPEAMDFFRNCMAAAHGREVPLTALHRKTLREARKRGWRWPSNYHTARRRWLALEEDERRTLRLGAKDAARSLAIRNRRTTGRREGVADL